MKKQEFIKSMNKIIANEKLIDKLEAVLSELSPDSHSSPITIFTEAHLEIMQSAMQDKDNWITYWYWELNKGKEAKADSVTDRDGKKIPIKTLGNLYDLLKSEI